MTGIVDIAMRSRNDLSQLRSTLGALSVQTEAFRLISFDNASTDGSRELLETFASRIINVPEGTYVPGKVLNRAMRESTSDIVIFLNADCEPLDDLWLAALLQPFANPHVGATFSRQVPRPDCKPLPAFDTEATYGDGSDQLLSRNGFSMASCGIRRAAWQQVQFDEALSYFEDIAWSLSLSRAGWSIQYAPHSRVYHSHNYSNRQWHNRQYGEGRAEAGIFTWSAWQSSFLRYSLLPIAKQAARDLQRCFRRQCWSAIKDIPGYRYAQMTGRRRGFLDGRSRSKRSSAVRTFVESL